MRVDRTQDVIYRTTDPSLITAPCSYGESDAVHLVFRPSDMHDVRVTDTNLVVLITGWFVGSEAICQAILDLRLAEQSHEFATLLGMLKSVSLSPCPISNELLARVADGIKTGITTTKDHDIITINHCILNGRPRTKESFFLKHDSQSVLLTNQIEVCNHLIERSFPDPGLSESWNGVHFIGATLFDRSLGDRTRAEEQVEVTSLRLESLGNLEIPSVDPDLTLKNTTTVVMGATEQRLPGELTVSDQQELSDSYGFGTVDTDELWARWVNEPLRPAAEIDLAAQLQGMGVLGGEPRIGEVFTYYPVKECPFNAKHKKVVLSKHRSGTITYLCPHYSCQGKKAGFDRKTARDYFTHYGVTIPTV